MLSKLAYLTLCRSMQVLMLLVRGDAAKDLEIVGARNSVVGAELRVRRASHRATMITA